MLNPIFITPLDEYKSKLEELEVLESSIKNTILSEILSAKKNQEETKKPLWCMVKFSQLSSVSWSPEYYNTDAQLIRIVEILEKCRSIRDIKEKLEKFYTDKKIIEKNYKVYLNEETLEVLEKQLNKLSSL